MSFAPFQAQRFYSVFDYIMLMSSSWLELEKTRNVTNMFAIETLLDLLKWNWPTILGQKKMNCKKSALSRKIRVILPITPVLLLIGGTVLLLKIPVGTVHLKHGGNKNFFTFVSKSSNFMSQILSIPSICTSPTWVSLL